MSHRLSGIFRDLATGGRLAHSMPVPHWRNPNEGERDMHIIAAHEGLTL